MASFWPYHQDYSSNPTVGFHGSPSLLTTLSMAPTPLMLPRDWLEYNSTFPSGEHDDFDFQSNHLDFTFNPPTAGSLSLAGLGIRNVDLAADLEALESDLPNVANTTFSVDHRGYNLHLSSIDPFENHHCDAVDRRQVYDDLDFTTIDSTWFLPSSREGSTGPHVVPVDSSTDLDPPLSPNVDPALGDPRTCTGTDTYNIGLSLEELSAATGISVADFAAQISATAEATLRTMTQDGLYCVEPKGEMSDDPLNFQSNSSQTTSALWRASDLLLPLCGENFRNMPAWNIISHGINPTEILSVQSPPSLQLFVPSPCQSLLDPWRGEDNVTETSHDLQSLAQETTTKSVEVDLEPLFYHRASVPNHTSGPLSDDDEQSLFHSPSSSEYSPSMRPSGPKRALTSRGNRRRVTRSTVRNDPAFQTPEPLSHYDESTLPPINLGTPVFDAHRGIDIEVLKAKAERYRLRNQGRDYDKRWLISFAGKLSPRGELVDEFRCYITGCKQTNKRRDHILIHVGAHLDQRPFKCMYCSSRFLRKNECKRHELSHTGIRPFSCHLCPYPSTTFVRQDLLKRHMKRTHRMQMKSDKENETPDRPKKKARF